MSGFGCRLLVGIGALFTLVGIVIRNHEAPLHDSDPNIFLHESRPLAVAFDRPDTSRSLTPSTTPTISLTKTPTSTPTTSATHSPTISSSPSNSHSVSPSATASPEDFISGPIPMIPLPFDPRYFNQSLDTWMGYGEKAIALEKAGPDYSKVAVNSPARIHFILSSLNSMGPFPNDLMATYFCSLEAALNTDTPSVTVWTLSDSMRDWFIARLNEKGDGEHIASHPKFKIKIFEEPFPVGSNPAVNADWIRMVTLYRYGGMYMDLDHVILNSTILRLGDFITGHNLYLSYEISGESGWQTTVKGVIRTFPPNPYPNHMVDFMDVLYINNTPMKFKKGSSFLRACMTDSAFYLNMTVEWPFTWLGPALLTRTYLASFEKSYGFDTPEMLPGRLALPKNDPCQVEKPDALAVHLIEKGDLRKDKPCVHRAICKSCPIAAKFMSISHVCTGAIPPP